MYKALVTGVGAIIGYGIIKSLRKSKYDVQIIGMDIYDDAIGRHWCDHFVQAVPANAPHYPEYIRSLVDRYNIDLIIPGIEQDGFRLAKESAQFHDLNVKLALNRHDLIDMAADKWLTFLELEKHDFPAIPTYIEGEFTELSAALKLPMLLKPRRSYASKGIQKIYSQTDFEYWKTKLEDNFMIQEIVGSDDEEFTVGAFGLGDGTISQQITFQRKLSGEGATSKAQIIQHFELEKQVEHLAQIFRPIGPTNFQYRKHNGQFLLLEINPRISSSTSLRSAFGYNEAEMCIEYFLEDKIPGQRELKAGWAQRYIEDWVTLC